MPIFPGFTRRGPTIAGPTTVGTAGQVLVANGDGTADWVTPAVPVNTVAPAVTGTATIGETLSCDTGTWDGTPASYSYQWQRDTGGGFANISGATANTHELVEDDVGADVRCVVTAVAVGGSASANSNIVSLFSPASLGDDLIDEWMSGEGLYQDSDALTPVTAAGQTVAAWVGRNGEKLTTSGGAMKAISIGGRLTPVSISDAVSAWVVPGTVSLDRRDSAAWLHLQAGSGWLGGLLGLGDDRGHEMYTYQLARIDSFNSTGGVKSSPYMPPASPCVLALDCRAGTRYIRRNAASYDTLQALPAGTSAGGFVGSLNGSGSPAETTCAIWHGIVLTTALGDDDRVTLLAYLSGRAAIPSDVSPVLNLVAMGDSNTAGSAAGGVSWQWMFAGDGARVLSSAMSGTYFSAGGAPQNSSPNLSMIAGEYLAGAGRNVVVIADTNDFSSASAASALSARETAAATLQGAGWEVCQPYMPHRVAPYADAVAYNAVIDTFNSALAGSSAFDYRPDLYTAFGGASPPGGTYQADGVHWTPATHSLVYAAIAASLGV